MQECSAATGKIFPTLIYCLFQRNRRLYSFIAFAIQKILFSIFVFFLVMRLNILCFIYY